MFKLDLRGVQRAEIWGIVVIACFNLALLTVAIRYAGLDPYLIVGLLLYAQACSLGVILLLLQIRHQRDHMDDLRGAADLLNKTNEASSKSIKSMAEALRGAIKTSEALALVLNDLPCQKKLPPDVKGF